MYVELCQNRSCSTHRLRSGQLSTAGIGHDAQLLQSRRCTGLLCSPTGAVSLQVAAYLRNVVRLLGRWRCRQLRQLIQGSAAGFERSACAGAVRASAAPTIKEAPLQRWLLDCVPHVTRALHDVGTLR